MENLANILNIPNLTKVVTGKVRFSYANVWEAKSVNGGDERYSVSLIIPKSDTKTLAGILSAIEQAIKEGGEKLGDGGVPVKREDLKLPLRDGDRERADDEAYQGSYFVNAISKIRPGIVDKNVKEILDPSKFYSGCYGRASIVFYAFNQNGNKGIACSLQNLQKLAEGEPLIGRSSPEEDFANADDEDFLA